MSLENIIKDHGFSLGIHKIGITDAEDLREESLLTKEYIKRGFISPEWKKDEIDGFFSPSSFMSEAKSVIMAGLCYYEEKKENAGNELYGEIPMYTWRNNYKFLRKKLEKLAEFIKKSFNMKYKIFVNGSLAEKPLARKSGIGFYGKNSIICSKKYGSRMVLGGITVDRELLPDFRQEINCSLCNICIEACPTGAIVSPYVIDRNKCIQYMSQTLNVAVPVSYRRLWGKRLYGCSTCQDICPLNKNVDPVSEFSPYGVIGSEIPLYPLLEMSEADFRKKYRDNQISAKWVDFEAIKRNALIVLENIKK